MSTSTMTRNFQRNAPTASRQYTPGQMKFLTDLVTQIAGYDVERGRTLWVELRVEQESGQLTFARASECIDALKNERGELRLAQQVDPAEDCGAPRPARPQVPEGRYAIDNAEGKTAFYRVAEKDGLLTVFVYASDAQHKLPWKTALPVLHKIEAYGLHEASVRFGVESETCYKCGKRLTREHTRAAGIGDDCAAKA
jgi:hypothetical protein